MNAINPVDASPRTETILWQGRPGFRAAAIRIWHLRLVIAWFAFLLMDGAVRLWRGHAPLPVAFDAEARLLLVGLCAIALLMVLAWLTARTTRYTITDHAVVMRIGIALQATLIIPFAAIVHVGVRIHPDGSGDVALRLVDGQSVMYPTLWPHARPWHVLRPEPMLRAIAPPGVAGSILSRAIGALAEARREAAAHQAEQTAPTS